MSYGAKLQLEPGSWTEAAYDIYIGTVVGARHSAFLVSRTFYKLLVQPFLTILGLKNIFEQAQETINTEGLKVVAVGYGRTGTVRRPTKISVAFASGDSEMTFRH
jgi:hypothetical protein